MVLLVERIVPEASYLIAILHVWCIELGTNEAGYEYSSEQLL